jgi:cystathionine beta-lyase family protein involved in aluminum resistance
MIETILGDRSVSAAVRKAAETALPRLVEDDPRRRAVRMRVLEAFLAEGIAESDLAGSTGYGYDDAARDRYESLLARVFRAERVLARLSIVSGTHAIVASLDGLLAPGGLLLCANGAPYDTLRYALVDAPYSLVARGVRYAEVERTIPGDTDLAALAGGSARRSSRWCAPMRPMRSCSSTTATANSSKSANRSKPAPT